MKRLFQSFARPARLTAWLSLLLPAALAAQTLAPAEATPETASAVQAVAQDYALPPVETVPKIGTTLWVVGTGGSGVIAPYPVWPGGVPAGSAANFPAFWITNGQVLIDATGGGGSDALNANGSILSSSLESAEMSAAPLDGTVAVASSLPRTTVTDTQANAQANAVINLINWLQSPPVATVTATLAAPLSSGLSLMAAGAPIPSAGGGGTVITPNAITQTFTTNDLWLQFAAKKGVVSTLLIHTPWNVGGSNFMFDVFVTTNLSRNVPGLNGTNWLLLARSQPGQTNLTVTLPANLSTNARAAFYRLGTLQDSDNDGLTDAYEMLVSHTDPNKWDSNGNGISDGDETRTNGLPWRLEAVRVSAAVIYANPATARQGGSNATCTVYLPQAAPVGGCTVKFYSGGLAGLGVDYTLSVTNNQLTIPAGNSSGSFTVSAAPNTRYAPLDLYADFVLTNATAFPVDGTPARVSIINTNLPGIMVAALPVWMPRPSPTYGTNPIGFYFVRGGPSTNAATVNFSLTGTAVQNVDYTVSQNSSFIFPANVRTNWLPVNILPNSTDPTNKSLTVKITAAPGYQLNADDATATLFIGATAAPTLPQVNVSASKVDATPGSPGQFTFTRSFATTNALRVFYHVWAGGFSQVVGRVGTNDTEFFSGLPGWVDIPAGATSATASVNNLGQLSTVQPVTVTLAAGEYTIGANNHQADVYLDGTGTASLHVTVAHTGVFNGMNLSQPAVYTITRTGSAISPLQVNWVLTNSYNGPVIQGGQRTGFFTFAARQSVTNISPSVTLSTTAQSLMPSLLLSSAIGSPAATASYLPIQGLFSVQGSSVITVNKGYTASVTVNRPSGASASDVYATLKFSGSAVAGTDYTVTNATVHFAANQTAATVSLNTLNPGTPGGKTVVVTIEESTATQVASINSGQTRAFVRIQDPQNTVTDTDMDGDGLSDGYELSNGMDPLTPDNPYTDNDRDGRGLLQELELGSNPNVADVPPVYPSVEDSDYVPLTVSVSAWNKMALPKIYYGGYNCAVCHTASLRVGNNLLTSPRVTWSQNPATQQAVQRYPRGTTQTMQVTCDPVYSSLMTIKEMTNYNNSLGTLWGSAHYNAAYGAQIWSGTNLYPFIDDPQHLMGSSNLLVQETLPLRATLYLPDLTIAADVNRDGRVDFTNRVDRTSSTNAFTFWLNDDVDSGSTDAAMDLDPSASTNTLNCANTRIDGLRDLEDFARLQFKLDNLPKQFVTNTAYQWRIYLTNLAGNPSLRLFPQTETNGGLGYLTNLTAASAQTNATPLGVLTNGTPLNFPATNWLAAGSNAWFLPLIFEGITAGQCVINFGLASNNAAPVALSRPFYLNLQKVTDLYEHWTVGDNTTNSPEQIPLTPSRTSDSPDLGKPRTSAEQDYVIMVHGWRMQPWERRAFASTAYKRMWHLGYQGRFVFYSWPTDYTDVTYWDMLNPITGTTNRQNYNRSEQRAWESGKGLWQLLLKLNEVRPPLRLHVIAHSMGNVVTSEALRLQGQRGTNRPPLVQGYIASQAASVAHAYDAVNPEVVRNGSISALGWFVPEIYASFPRNGTNQPYYTGMKNTVQGSNIFNFNNRDDYALSQLKTWPGNQDTKPDSGWASVPGMRWQRLNPSPLPPTRLELDRSDMETHEIMAHIAIAHSKALGAAEDDTHHISGEIGKAVNLNAAPFNFKANDYEHSAQFNSINMNRRLYWWQVLGTFGLTNNLPQP